MSLSVRHLTDEDLRSLVRHNLRKACANSKTSHASIAEESGLTEPRVAAVMEERGHVDAVDLLRVVAVLRIDLDDLMTPTTEMLNRRTPFIIHRDAKSLGKLVGFVVADQMHREP